MTRAQDRHRVGGLALCLIVWLLCLAPMAQAEPTLAGHVSFLSGSAQRAGTATETLAPNSPVYVGDVLATGPNSELHVEMEDGGMLALRSGSSLRIDHFAAEGKDTDGQAVSLLKGALRAISGWVGKSRPQNYSLTASTITIGVRGTDFEVIKGEDETAHVQVLSGGVDLKSPEGQLPVDAGHAAWGGHGRSLAFESPNTGFYRQFRGAHENLLNEHSRQIAEHMRTSLVRHQLLRPGESAGGWLARRHAESPERFQRPGVNRFPRPALPVRREEHALIANRPAERWSSHPVRKFER